jgi:hypothetical protein
MLSSRADTGTPQSAMTATPSPAPETVSLCGRPNSATATLSPGGESAIPFRAMVDTPSPAVEADSPLGGLITTTATPSPGPESASLFGAASAMTATPPTTQEKPSPTRRARGWLPLTGLLFSHLYGGRQRERRPSPPLIRPVNAHGIRVPLSLAEDENCVTDERQATEAAVPATPARTEASTVQTPMSARTPVSSRTVQESQGAPISPALTSAKTVTPNSGRRAAAETLSKEAEAIVPSSHQPADDDNAEGGEAEAGAAAETAARIRES